MSGMRDNKDSQRGVTEPPPLGHSLVPLQVLTETGTIVRVTDAWVEMFGCTESSATAHPFVDFLDDESSARFESDLRACVEDGAEIDDVFTVTVVGGQPMAVLIRGRRAVGESGTHRVHCYLTDVSAVHARAARVERFRKILDQSNDAIFVIDPATFALVDVNETACRRLGYTREELLSLHPAQIETTMQDPREWAQGLDPLRERGGLRYEGAHRRKDGSTFPVEVEISHVSLGKDYIVSIARDVTVREEFERHLRDQRDSLDLLNQVLSHDIRNDLQVITGYADLLEEHVTADGEAYLASIQRSARQAIELTRTARDVAGALVVTEEALRPIDLKPVLDAELTDLREANADVVVTVDGTIPAVMVRADDLLGSVFENLLKNAVLHNDTDAPEVTVSVETDDTDVVVEVSDNGPGVPTAIRDTVFTRGGRGLHSSGTGIGLYLVQTLVGNYGGSISLDDAVPRGARFVVRLPRAGEELPTPTSGHGRRRPLE